MRPRPPLMDKSTPLISPDRPLIVAIDRQIHPPNILKDKGVFQQQAHCVSAIASSPVGLPERYGPWQTVATHFYRWRKAGIWDRLFAGVQQQTDAAGHLDWHVYYVEATIIRAHQHVAGAQGGTQKSKR
jgi:hypothetical protein